jgi:PPK2 family polyphosphate:nucleotide phosphotransferase
MPTSVADKFRAKVTDEGFTLSALDPADRNGMSRKKAEKEFRDAAATLSGLQERLYAENRLALLIVLQGMDASGKDGTVSHVMAQVNPQGVDVTSFKQPTPVELRHPFLWRIRNRVPGPGRIAIFNRSQYEDVLVPLVHRTVPDRTIDARYRQINAFEKKLVGSGVIVLKFMLHISFEEQRLRLLERLRRPDKRWKFNANDLKERADWDLYMAAYDRAIAASSTDYAPWYVIPSDRKWFRNWSIGHIVVETLNTMNPQYPQPKLDIKALEARLAAPKQPSAA